MAPSCIAEPGSRLTERQRIDKWLWHCRVVRTRVAAADLASGGDVRINGVRIAAASRAVQVGDVVTVTLFGRIRVLKVAGFARQRGSSEAARRLYEDLESHNLNPPLAPQERVR